MGVPGFGVTVIGRELAVRATGVRRREEAGVAAKEAERGEGVGRARELRTLRCEAGGGVRNLPVSGAESADKPEDVSERAPRGAGIKGGSAVVTRGDDDVVTRPEDNMGEGAAAKGDGACEVN